MKKRLLCLAVIFAIALSATSCSKTPDLSNKKLSISVCYDFYDLETAVEKFQKIHPDVEIVLNKYDNDAEKYKQQVSAQLMSGDSDDLLDATGISDTGIADSGLLADFYPLMEKDSNFDKNDYYTNVFDGVAYNNKLTAFPVCFGYNIIGVNNQFSKDLADKFKSYDKITYREVLDLYKGLEDKGNRYVSKNIDAISSIYANFNTFVDVKNKKCSFNSPAFIDFITDAKDGTAPEKKDSGELGYTYGYSYYEKGLLEEYALQYLFLNADSNNYQVFIPSGEEEIFTHFIPLVNEEGSALMYPQKRFCISEASKNKEIAWEFVKFLTTPEANEDVYVPSFPVNKTLFKSYITADLEGFIDYWRESDLAVEGETADIVAKIMSIYDRYNAMPMEYQKYIDTTIIQDVMLSFYDGVLTAEQAASELQNKISLYLME